MCLRILPSKDINKDILEISKELLGKICYVKWPYLTEGRVWALSDGQYTYFDEKRKYDIRGGGRNTKVIVSKRKLLTQEEELWKSTVVRLNREYSRRRAIDLGDVNILVYVEELQGKKYVIDKSGPRVMATLEKQWSASPTPYPLQLLVMDIAQYAPDIMEKHKSIEELYEVGSPCFILSSPYYGEQAEIVKVDTRSFQVIVKFSIPQEPNLESALNKYEQQVTQYSSQTQVAQRLNIHPVLVARITSSLICEQGSACNKKERNRVNLGLNMRHRDQELVGYAMKSHNGTWLLSTTAESILKDYITKFPKMFVYLNEHCRDDHFYENEIFPLNGEYVYY
jgi:hypothetical protein